MTDEGMDLAAFALGLLDEAAHARVEAHIRTCAGCTRELAELRAVREILPYALTTESVPDNAWHSIETRIRQEQRARTPGLFPRLLGWLPARRVLQPALVAALAATVAGLIAWNVVLLTSDGGGATAPAQASGRITVYLGTLAPGSEADGQLRMTASRDLGGLIIEGLPALPSGQSYQLWFVRPDQSRVSGGTFDVDPLGQAIVEIALPQPVEQFDGVGISEEPEGGSPTPTTRDVLAGIIYAD